jgi:signal transduction histidine kinase
VKFDRPDLQSSIQAFWKIISPILLLGILLIISHYVLRQYNKKLKKQVHLNIEELREKDEMLLQKQRMAAMGEMLSLIAHQWRQPLGAINSAIMGINIKIESGRFDLNDPIEQQKFLEYLKRKHDNIIDSVQYLSTTTDDFRNFFNPNKSKESTPLVAPIENALKVIEHSLRGWGDCQ